MIIFLFIAIYVLGFISFLSLVSANRLKYNSYLSENKNLSEEERI